jgi:hypothetical protein
LLPTQKRPIEVNLAVTDLKEAETIFDVAKIVTVDLTPPESLTNLMESGVGPSWIRWQWTNPKDADFKHVMVYLDNVFVTNTSDGFYNATGLADGVTYNIGVQTVDTSGNINSLRVTDSATTLKLRRSRCFWNRYYYYFNYTCMGGFQ